MNDRVIGVAFVTALVILSLLFFTIRFIDFIIRYGDNAGTACVCCLH